ncbi:rRNA-processing protein FYV7 [Athalia rosae]|uniref:rRNA-processing protein FYV7 n=1 Tax=Athalia rosae TaxID=37344 RepID=UPI00203327AE|nr:rRNA-processing protein FYV7 [Athalia rosae]
MSKDNKEIANNKGNKNQRDEKTAQTKKPFDKKTYRLKKYSNKYKVDQWEDRRKKAVLRRYYKDVKKEQKHAAQNSELSKKESESGEGKSSISEDPQFKGNAFYAAKQEYRKKKEEKMKKKEEIQRRKEEKIEALKKYKEAKALKYKKLSKKTKKGQPVMKDRLEMLLEKIQQTI